MSKIEHALEVVRDLNSTANGRMGVGVLKSVIASLERGSWEDASAVANLDSDKLHQYPGVHEKMTELGLVSEVNK